MDIIEVQSECRRFPFPFLSSPFLTLRIVVGYRREALDWFSLALCLTNNYKSIANSSTLSGLRQKVHRIILLRCIYTSEKNYVHFWCYIMNFILDITELRCVWFYVLSYMCKSLIFCVFFCIMFYFYPCVKSTSGYGLWHILKNHSEVQA